MGMHDDGVDGVRRTPLYLDAPDTAASLRVVLVTPPVVPAWLATFVAEASASAFVDLEVVPSNSVSPPRRGRLSFDLGLFLSLERIVFRWLGRVIGRRVVGPLSRLALGGSRQSDPGSIPALLARLEASSPDLVLLHGAEEHAEELAGLARYGCWILDPDLTDPGYAGLPLLAPIIQGDKATGMSLYLVPKEVEGHPADAVVTSYGATSAMSFSQQRDLALAKLPALLLRVLRRQHDGRAGSAGTVQSLRMTPPSFSLQPNAGVRSFAVAIRQFLDWRGRRIRARLPWFLLLPGADSALDPAVPRIAAHTSLVAPGKDYWADPFPLSLDGRRLLFVEEFVDAQNKGIIVCLELLEDGTATRLGVVLDEDAHLSYPQVFEWEGKWYMTVESCEANRVSLYAAEEFPLRWRRVSDLVEGRECVDPTLHHHDGVWYLFGNISESGGGLSDELFLFTADRLDGPYRPHPDNPILSDARMSRPAGRLFTHNGKLVRPAQCCVPIYGAAVVFNEVLELSPLRYRERPMSRLEPDALPGLDGCHTYNVSQGFEVLDAHGQPPPEVSRMALVGPVGQ